MALDTTLLDGSSSQSGTWGDHLPLNRGDLVGNYRIAGLLGQGGMGAVFAAVHKDIHSRAAIKVLHADRAENPQLAARFMNEARAVNMIRHPGLVEIFEYGTLPTGAPFLIMEHLEGELLRDRMDRAAGAPVGGALAICRQIALALAAAHDRQIVHRDLKPANVMLLPDPLGPERVKVFDFGLAKLTSQEPSRDLTLTGVALGTPAYMAPEQCQGMLSVDGKADVYALGIVLYEMLSGRLPFSAKLPYEFIAQHMHATPEPLPRSGPEAGPETAALGARMLAKAPVDRPTMEEVAAELGLLLGAPVSTQTLSRTRRQLPRVLVIDDQPDLAESICAVLEESGYSCAALLDGAGALEEIRRARPDTILMDVEMPGKSGYKLCWDLKHSPETADIPIILMSAKSLDQDRKLGLAMQADAYLVKPFDLNVLLDLLLKIGSK